MSGRTSRSGRVAVEKVFEPTVRKRRLVQHKYEDTTVDSAKTAEGGAWLKKLREERGLSQPQVVEALGMKYLAAISMIESGKNRLAPANFAAYADAVGMDLREFVVKLISFYHQRFLRFCLATCPRRRNDSGCAWGVSWIHISRQGLLGGGGASEVGASKRAGKC